jgi:hypothetical protein
MLVVPSEAGGEVTIVAAVKGPPVAPYVKFTVPDAPAVS